VTTITKPTTSATITAQTAEGCLFQALNYMQVLELNAAKNPNKLERITGVADKDSLEYRGTWALQVQGEILPDGALKVSTVPYLQGTNFTPGEGGTFSGETLEQYAFQVLNFLIQRQNDPTANPNQRFYVQETIDLLSNPPMASGSFRIPIQTALGENGQVFDTPMEYLL
jgi:hypothetical protein